MKQSEAANEAEKGVAYCLARNPSPEVSCLYFLMDLARFSYTLTDKSFLQHT